MTKKQFFKKVGAEQPREKKFFTDVIKKYKGRLSYLRFYLLLYAAISLGKRGDDALTYVDVIINSNKKEVKP